MDVKGYFVSDIPRRAFLERTMKGGLVVAAGPTLLSLLEGCAPGEMANGGGEVDPHLLNSTIQRAMPSSSAIDPSQTNSGT